MLLIAIGLLFLVVSVAGIFIGVFMATDTRTRGQGVLFAVSWISGVAAASGVLMRDVVTFAVGLLCLLLAGAALVFEGGGRNEPPARRRNDPSKGIQDADKSRGSEKTTKENRSDPYGKAAS